MFKNGTRMADYRLYSQNWNFVSKSGPWDHFFGIFFTTAILGIEGITRMDFWILFPKFMILNKNKKWKKKNRDTTQNFPKISRKFEKKSGNVFLPSSVEVLF